MVYQSLANTAYYIDDNDSSKERTIYIKDDRHVIGYVESNKRNGFLYDKNFTHSQTRFSWRVVKII